MPRKVITALAIVWTVLVGGAFTAAYFVPTVTATHIRGDATIEDQEVFVWEAGETLILERSRKRTSPRCTAVSAEGERHTLRRSRTGRWRTPIENEPFFATTADVTCTGSARIHSGRGADLHTLSKNKVVVGGAAVLALGPGAALYVFGRRRG